MCFGKNQPRREGERVRESINKDLCIMKKITKIWRFLLFYFTFATKINADRMKGNIKHIKKNKTKKQLKYKIVFKDTKKNLNLSYFIFVFH